MVFVSPLFVFLVLFLFWFGFCFLFFQFLVGWLLAGWVFYGFLLNFVDFVVLCACFSLICCSKNVFFTKPVWFSCGSLVLAGGKFKI